MISPTSTRFLRSSLYAYHIIATPSEAGRLLRLLACTPWDDIRSRGRYTGRHDITSMDKHTGRDSAHQAC